MVFTVDMQSKAREWVGWHCPLALLIGSVREDYPNGFHGLWEDTYVSGYWVG